MKNLIGKRVQTYDGHSGIVIKVHIRQNDGRIWYCPEKNIEQIIDDNKISSTFLFKQISEAISEEIDLTIKTQKLQSISGYTIEQLTEMFLAGWEMKPPNYKTIF